MITPHHHHVHTQRSYDHKMSMVSSKYQSLYRVIFFNEQDTNEESCVVSAAAACSLLNEKRPRPKQLQ